MERLFIRLGTNALALFVAAQIIPGIHSEGLIPTVAAAVLFGVVNAFIRPLVSFFTCLLQILTLGLFTLVINAGMLLLTSWVAQTLGIGFWVEGFLAALWGALVVSVVSTLLSWMVH